MPRNNKKTRIKSLPPKLETQALDNRAGHFPAKPRIASDNRSGNYKVRYDDNCTILFGPRVDVISDVIAYYRFNSASNDNEQPYNQVSLRTQTANSISYGVAPVHLNDSRGLAVDAYQFEYSSVHPPTFAHFEAAAADAPFAGPSDDPNLTVVDYALADFTRVTGSSRIWNPGVENAVSGADVADKPFSISVRLSNLGFQTSQVLLACGDTDSTHEPVGTLSGANMMLEHRPGTGAILLWLNDSQNNAIVKSWTSAVPVNSDWHHVLVTYSGERNYESFALYVNGEDAGAGGNGFQGTFGSYGGMSASLDNHRLYFGCLGDGGANDRQYDGYLDELIIFDRVLSAGEVADIFRFNRTLTKLTGNLNPFGGIYYGSTVDTDYPFMAYPTEQTTSLNGAGSVIKGVSDTFADFNIKTDDVFVFVQEQGFDQQQQQPITINVPTFATGLKQDLNPFRDNSNPAVDGKSLNQLFYTTGSTVEEAGEGFTSPLWSKTKIEVPINVKSDVQLDTYIATDRITNGSQTFSGVGTGLSWPISYFNFQKSTWSGQGLGIAYAQLTQSINQGKGPYYNPFKDYNMLGFACSPVMISPESAAGTWNNVISGVFEWQASAGTPVSNYGFPFHPKFHATASNVLLMNKYITRPFLVEKIYIELSASFTWAAETYTTASFSGFTGNTITSVTESLVPACINNIFVMNQRRNVKFDNVQRVEFLAFDEADPLDDSLIDVSIPTQFNVNSTSEKIYVNTSRELVAYGGVSSFASNMPPTASLRAGSTSLFTNAPPVVKNPTELLSREVNFFSTGAANDNLEALSWSGIVQLELQARSPIEIDRVNANTDNVFSIHGEASDSSFIVYADLKYSFGGRNGLGVDRPTGKDRRSPTAALQPTEKFVNLFSLGKENILVPYEEHTIPNGYLLEPGDELILGWQQPVPMFIYPTGSDGGTDPDSKNVWDNTTLTSITFHPHPEAKIILYGSEIREDREHHDTLNQLLTTIAVHEVIE